MTKRVQRYGLTAAAMASLTGLDREIIIDTTNYTLVVHDGVTAGGHKMLNQAQIVAGYQPLASDLTTVAGFVAQTGILCRTAAASYAFRTMTGNANEIAITNADGVAGAPNFGLPVTLTFTGKTITGGTFSSPTINTPTFGANVVPNTALAQMPANTIKGNNTGSLANAADLTVAQVQSMFTAVGLINVQVFTGNGTYTPTTGTNFVLIEIQAPGGGGGGAAATTAGNNAYGNCGGAGSFARVFCTLAQVTAATLVVPSGGAGGVAGNNAGAAASAASFILAGQASISCPGGLGGPGGPSVANGLSAGATGAAATAVPTISGVTATLFSIQGKGNNVAISTSAWYVWDQGASQFSWGASLPVASNTAGSNAVGFGGGGGPGQTANGGGIAGGNGSGARVIVWEFR